MMKQIYSLLGIEQTSASYTEQLVSALGGFIAIYCIYITSQAFVDSITAAVIISSMGSSAVLLFAVPHGQSSQPWPVFGGHMVSVVIGVTCAQYVPDIMLAASLAVGLAIGVMYFLRCLHAPGGATAISVVIGGEPTQTLGYQLVVTPVLLNVLIILSIAFLFNFAFGWRRYPYYLYQRQLADASDKPTSEVGDISHADFVYALSQIDSFVDVNEHELMRIYELATQQSQRGAIDPARLALGGYYSNGAYGDGWCVRQIVDESSDDDPARDTVVFKVVAGRGRRSSGYATRDEFSRWARYQVIRDEDNWKRLEE
jgi:CBS-domain-containing membrane protein